MPVEENIIVVSRFFKEAIDGGNLELLNELFTEDCVIHRPNASIPLEGHDGIRKVITRAHQQFNDFSTEIYFPSRSSATYPKPSSSSLPFVGVPVFVSHPRIV